MLALLSLIACRHTPPASPIDWTGSSREVLLDACSSRQPGACAALSRDLERAGERQQAHELALTACREADEASCFAGALMARDPASPATAAERTELDERLCDTGLSYACVRRAQEGPDAATWWEKGCDYSDLYACEMAAGRVPPASDLPLPPDFADQLAAAGLVFTPPPGFVVVEPTENPDFGWSFGIRALDGSVEIRYQVNDLASWNEKKAACDAQEGCIMAEPNSLGAAFAMVSAMNMAQGAPEGPTDFPVDGVHYEFNAEWGSVYGFFPRETFAPGWERGLLMSLHNDDVGDARVVMLVNGDLSPAWYAGFHALRFADEHHP